MIETITVNYCTVQPKHQQAGKEENCKLQSRQTVRWAIQRYNNFINYLYWHKTCYTILLFHEAIIRQLNILPVPDDGFVEKPKHVARLGNIFFIDGPPLFINARIPSRYLIRKLSKYV